MYEDALNRWNKDKQNGGCARADPEAGKGRGTNVSGWRESDSLVNCCIFEAGNNHLFSVSLLIFAILAFARWL